MSDAQLKPGDPVGKLTHGINLKNDLVELLQPIVAQCLANLGVQANQITDVDGNGNFS